MAATSIEEVISADVSNGREKSLVIAGLERSALAAAKLLYTVHVSGIVEVEVVGTHQSGMVIYVVDN